MLDLEENTCCSLEKINYRTGWVFETAQHHKERPKSVFNYVVWSLTKWSYLSFVQLVKSRSKIEYTVSVLSCLANKIEKDFEL